LVLGRVFRALDELRRAVRVIDVDDLRIGSRHRGAVAADGAEQRGAERGAAPKSGPGSPRAGRRSRAHRHTSSASFTGDVAYPSAASPSWPSTRQPQQDTLPSTTAQPCVDPRSTDVAPSNPTDRTGIARSTRVPSASSPCLLAPQQCVLPSSVVAHVLA